MPTLYLSEQNTQVHRDGNRFVVKREGKIVGTVHDFNVERVVVYGHVHLSPAVIDHFLKCGIDTCFVGLGGKLKGRLVSLESKNVHARAKQFERFRDEAFALGIARSVVAGKLANGREVLMRAQRNHPELNLQSETDRLTNIIRKVTNIVSAESLLGVEGHGATVYFEGFGKLFRTDLKFQKRVRRPPTDGVNAMLSLGYTLLYNEGVAAVCAVGFDPYFGFFHKLDYGRCSLALDLIEEFRPITVDRLVLQMVNLGMVSPESFEPGEGGAVLLKDDARKRFFTEYERIMTEEFTHVRSGEKIGFRRAINNQALALRRAVADAAPYRNFQGWH